MILYDLLVESKRSNKFISAGKLYCTDGSFVSPEEFSKNENKVAVAYLLTDDTAVSLRKTNSTYNWSDSNEYCLSLKNGYLPSDRELRTLYDSIMGRITYGRMKRDLMKAGIYELCNYRLGIEELDSPDNWGSVWSSTYYCYQHPIVTNSGGSLYYPDSDKHYVIPFYKLG